ncbi:MAG: C45 family autoproteolytic acyltransferase/hydrolase [Myxococcota bacterium]
MSLRLRVALLLALVATCAAVATGMRVSTDLADALPAEGPTGRAFADIRRFSLLDTVIVEVDGTGRPEEELHAAVDALGGKLAARTDEYASVRWRFGVADGVALRKAAAPGLGVLVDAGTLADATSEDGMRRRLLLARDRMLGPAGSLLAKSVRSDPLDLGGAFAEGVLGMSGTNGVALRGGHLVAEDGAHALILARARQPALGTSLEDPLVRNLLADLAASPLPASWIGSHRFAAEAQGLIKGEVHRAVTAGLVLLAAVFLVAFRSLRPLAGALPAIVVGGAVSAAAAALRSPIHGMALAFGGALAGMGVDYWIHLYLTGIREGVAPTFRERLAQGEGAFRHLLPAYAISVAATCTAFAMLATSSYQAVADLGWIGMGTALGAIVSTALAGPVAFAAVARPGDALPRLPVPERVPAPLATALLAGVAVLAIYGTGVRFDGDPRSMDARLPETAKAERAFQERYGSDATTGLVVAEADDLDGALEELRAATVGLAGAPGIRVRSPLPLLPPASERAARAAVLADPAIEARFLAAADDVGFDGASLLDGLRATLSATTAPTPAAWEGTPGEDILDRTVAIGPDGVAVAAIVSALTREALDHARHEVELTGADARFVTPAGVAIDGAERIRAELLTRSGLGLFAVLVFMALRYRDVPRVFAAALPSLAAAGGTMGVLALTGQALTPVSGPAFVLVLGVAFDQGIFLVEAGQVSRSAYLSSRAAILVALCTALAGFAGLCAATHPAVFSVGLTVSLGIAFTFAGAFLVVPAVLTPAGQAATRRWAGRLALAAVVFLNVDAVVAIWGQARPPAVPAEVATFPLDARSPTDRRYGPNRLARSHGVWVMRVEGDAYDLGHAMGQLAGDLRYRNEDAIIAEFYAHVPNRLARYLLVRGVPLFADRLARSLPPAYPAELRGYTDVGEDPWGWLSPHFTRKLCYHAIHDVGQAMVDSPLLACTGFYAGGSRTADGHWLLARNWDFDGGRLFDEDKAVIAVAREGAIPFVHVAIVGLSGVVSGVNAEGIGVAVLAGASDAPIRAGAPMIFVVREVLENAGSLDEAKAILEARKGFVSEGLLIVDADAGEGAVFEVTPERVEVLAGGEARALSNHFRAPAHAGDAANRLRIAEGTTAARLARMEELLGEPGAIDVPRAAAMLRDRRGVGGRELPLGHESAINADIASHGVIVDATERAIYVSAWPNLAGGFVKFALADLLAGELDGERVIGPDSPERTLKVHEARRLVKLADTQPAEAAEETLRRALRVNPGDVHAEIALGEVLLARGRKDEAAELARLALATPPARAAEARAAQRVLEEATR